MSVLSLILLVVVFGLLVSLICLAVNVITYNIESAKMNIIKEIREFRIKEAEHHMFYCLNEVKNAELTSKLIVAITNQEKSE